TQRRPSSPAPVPAGPLCEGAPLARSGWRRGENERLRAVAPPLLPRLLPPAPCPASGRDPARLRHLELAWIALPRCGGSSHRSGRPDWRESMEGRVTLLCRLLLIASILAGILAPLRHAHAQAGDTHLVFSEILADLDGTDRYREFYEIANLGDKPWDAKNHW